MKPVVTWVLIADGTRAVVLEHKGPGRGLAAVKGLDFEQPALQAREIMADKQGRSFSSAGLGRSGMEYKTNPVEYREAEFIRGVAAVLDRKCAEGAYNRLVVAAPPTALGVIRAAFSPEVKKSLLAELPKNLTNVPSPELGKYFEGILVI